MTNAVLFPVAFVEIVLYVKGRNIYKKKRITYSDYSYTNSIITRNDILEKIRGKSNHRSYTRTLTL